MWSSPGLEQKNPRVKLGPFVWNNLLEKASLEAALASRVAVFSSGAMGRDPSVNK